MDVLLVLDDLAVVVQRAANTPDPAGRRSTTYAANLAQELCELRAKLREPGDDIAGMEYGAREWCTALCAALDNVPLQLAGFAVLREEMRGGGQ
jgi:hypothetical protein